MTDAAGKPDYWDAAVGQLMRRDRILRRLIPRLDGAYLQPQESPFATLARAVVSRQASTRSANLVWRKLLAGCDGEPTPPALLDAGLAGLRAWGVAQRKGELLLALASHVADGSIEPAAWVRLDDDAIIRELTAIPGMGRWTAEMFLIFNLRRPDVLPLDDKGLMQAISLHYFSGEPVSRFEAREVAQAWQPWSTVATWHLWRSLELDALEL